jgi:solute carrier family 12 (sodium/potassium/chloride transporter), member 2
MLLPHIISARSNYVECDIRVFALANQKLELETEERNMAKLLAKLRIDYSSLIMVQGISDRPDNATIAMHTELLDGFMEGQRDDDCFVPKSELASLKAKTYRQLRLRELLRQHSMEANMIFMSLPMPRREAVSAPLYMSWLEVLTRGMPKMVLVRGNQMSVLTFYS